MQLAVKPELRTTKNSELAKLIKRTYHHIPINLPNILYTVKFVNYLICSLVYFLSQSIKFR